MENDFLKQFVNNHRKEFDDEQLPPELSENLIGKPEVKHTAIRRWMTFSAIAAACVALLLLLVFYKKNEQPTRHAIAHSQTQSDSKLNNKFVENDFDSVKDDVLSVEAYVPERNVAPVKHYVKTANKDVTGKIISQLAMDNPTSIKINAILKAGEMKDLNDKLKKAVGQVFVSDHNSNVRLAALNLLAGYAKDSLTKNYLINGMSIEKDPVIQLELIRIMSADQDAIVTNTLIQMSQTHFILPEVKDQVAYALLMRQ